MAFWIVTLLTLIFWLVVATNFRGLRTAIYRGSWLRMIALTPVLMIINFVACGVTAPTAASTPPAQNGALTSAAPATATMTAIPQQNDQPTATAIPATATLAPSDTVTMIPQETATETAVLAATPIPPTPTVAPTETAIPPTPTVNAPTPTATALPQDTVTPVPAQAASTSACHSVGGLPDPGCTPGAVDASLTAATLCASTYRTSTVRPPTSYTDALKVKQMALYGLTGTTALYEEDHLIPLELGGDPRSEKNLWPERWDTVGDVLGAHAKDDVENYLHDQVCAIRMALSDAQSAIASNWVAVYQSLPARKATGSGAFAAAPTATSAPAVAVPTATAAAATSDQTNATALCKDGTYWYNPVHRGACSRHGGVAQWLDGS